MTPWRERRRHSCARSSRVRIGQQDSPGSHSLIQPYKGNSLPGHRNSFSGNAVRPLWRRSRLGSRSPETWRPGRLRPPILIIFRFCRTPAMSSTHFMTGRASHFSNSLPKLNRLTQELVPMSFRTRLGMGCSILSERISSIAHFSRQPPSTKPLPTSLRSSSVSRIATSSERPSWIRAAISRGRRFCRRSAGSSRRRT